MAVKEYAAIIAEAKRLSYIIEDPVGSNDGPTLRQELQFNTLWQPGQPWCLYWAQRVIELAFPAIRQLAPWLLATGSCSRLADLAHEHLSIWDAPVMGGIILLTNDNGRTFFHAGIDVGPLPGSTSVRLYRSGNTNDTGSPEGYKVCEHQIFTGHCRWVSWPDQ